MNRIRTMSRRSAGPLISKFRNNELARKRSRVSSMMSGWLGSAGDMKTELTPNDSAGM